MNIGIGVITYNRLDHLKQVLAGVFTYTASPFHLMVADDGSTDGSREFAEAAGVTVVGSGNAGIAWNKNRALYTLRERAQADVIILLEDDTIPCELGWETLWVETVLKHGYATYCHPKVKFGVVAGSGTPADPYANTKITSQCSAVTREALDKAGYFDTRFKGYGVEDGEWTVRLRRTGSGLLRVPDPAGGEVIKANVMIDGGVRTIDADSYRTKESVQRNRALQAEIRNEPVPRPVWRSDEERDRLLFEVAQALERVPMLVQPGRAR